MHCEPLHVHLCDLATGKGFAACVRKAAHRMCVKVAWRLAKGCTFCVSVQGTGRTSMWLDYWQRLAAFVFIATHHPACATF